MYITIHSKNIFVLRNKSFIIYYFIIIISRKRGNIQ